MTRRWLIVFTMGIFLAIWGLSSFAQEAKKEAAKPEYVGDKKCKMCHKEEHASWLTTKHATAYDTLSAADKKKDSCVVCHVTGFGIADSLFEGVQCEACHGPGSLYKDMKIMSKKKYEENREAQHKLALAAGLVVPDEKTCTGCHNEKSPTFKDFDYAKMKTKGIHALKGAEPQPEAQDSTGG